MHFATPYKCRSKEMDAYLRGLNDGAEAQQKKIFNDPKVCIKADDQSLPDDIYIERLIDGEWVELCNAGELHKIDWVKVIQRER